MKEASNQQKLYFVLLTWPWRVSKSFQSSKDEGVACICIQCGWRKQNYLVSFGKTAFIQVRVIDLRVIPIAHLIDQ